MAKPDDLPPQVDLFTVLTALGSGLHADLSPISVGAQHVLANALVIAAGQDGWACATETAASLLTAVQAARRSLAAPMALVPVEVADPEVLVELGIDPQGPADLDGLLAAGLACEVTAGLVLLASPGGLHRRRDNVRSVNVPLPEVN